MLPITPPLHHPTSTNHTSTLPHPTTYHSYSLTLPHITLPSFTLPHPTPSPHPSLTPSYADKLSGRCTKNYL
ncbi:hypothetical protein Pmani_026922 [Petrolisthes manimaculis]|uniref:Uncharacterized protein n=1 Tax=Petrolisthes manimaculis TaxID=1843537 RepID=A0AAE1P4X2_9EUCA|nr:hypothetical protein Pmani_026922 [Petrolisthes manimaculis]